MSLRSKSEAAEIRQLRVAAGLSQSDIARITGYEVRQVKRWEGGQSSPRVGVLELLRTLPANRARPIKTGDFTFIDLFAGIGGLRLGFESAGGKCVFTSEWDTYSQKTYKANFGNEEIHGDITHIEGSSIPHHDVLLAGFPCQPFSLAGVSKKNALGRPHGFACETQGTLFFDVERIIAEKRPKAFLLENVKHLVNHDGGRTFAVIQQVLKKKLGYHVFPKLIDGRQFVPQHRERIYLVGFREDLEFSWDELDWPASTEWPTLASILHPEDGSEVPESPFTDERGRVHPKYTLSKKLWQYLKGYADKHKALGNGFGFGLVGPEDVARTLSARYYKDGSEILIRQKGKNPRRLTPRECARLMGFDRGDRRFVIPVSDTRAYKQFGNSVVVPVVETIAKAMRPYILGGKGQKEQLDLALAMAV
jgi:DNA (cytosine-5)-methyltransferase 1